MSNQIVKSAIRQHNNVQLDYFYGKVKKTMVPVDTYYVNRHVDELIKHSKINREDTILEVGCGMGKFTLPLLRRGYKITGNDLSPFLLQKLLEYNGNVFNIELISSDILEMPEEYNGKFDSVIGFFTLHHFLHLETYLQVMKRLLKSNGSIIFVEPNAYNPLYYLQILFSRTMSWKGDKGVAMMRKKVFEKAANYAGLENLTIAKYGFFPPFAVNNRTGQLAESILEKAKIFNGISAFQIIKMDKYD